MVCGPQYCSNKPKNSDVIGQSSISMNLLTESAFWFKDLGIHWTDNSLLFRIQNSKILIASVCQENCMLPTSTIRTFDWLSRPKPFDSGITENWPKSYETVLHSNALSMSRPESSLLLSERSVTNLCFVVKNTVKNIMWTADIRMKWRCDHRGFDYDLSNRKLSLKNVFGASSGFERMASALALQCSTNHSQLRRSHLHFIR